MFIYFLQFRPIRCKNTKTEGQSRLLPKMERPNASLAGCRMTHNNQSIYFCIEIPSLQLGPENPLTLRVTACNLNTVLNTPHSA